MPEGLLQIGLFHYCPIITPMPKSTVDKSDMPADLTIWLYENGWVVFSHVSGLFVYEQRFFGGGCAEYDWHSASVVTVLD